MKSAHKSYKVDAARGHHVANRGKVDDRAVIKRHRHSAHPIDELLNLHLHVARSCNRLSAGRNRPAISKRAIERQLPFDLRAMNSYAQRVLVSRISGVDRSRRTPLNKRLQCNRAGALLRGNLKPRKASGLGVHSDKEASKRAGASRR